MVAKVRLVVASLSGGNLAGHVVALVVAAHFPHEGDYLVLGVDRSRYHALLSAHKVKVRVFSWLLLRPKILSIAVTSCDELVHLWMLMLRWLSAVGDVVFDG